MKTLKQIYIELIVLVAVILIVGIGLGTLYKPIGESAHTTINNGVSMSAVKSVATDNFKLILTIFVCNSFIATGFIVLSYLKIITQYVRYVIYYALSYQIFMVALLIGYTTHFVSAQKIIASLVPHGVIEIPIIMLAAAYGIYLCQPIEKPFATQVNNYLQWHPTQDYVDRMIITILAIYDWYSYHGIKESFTTQIKNYSRWILVPLFIAAIVEVYVTPYIINII